jgi:hypothetical protein
MGNSHGCLGGGRYPTVGLSGASDVGKDSGVGEEEVKVDTDTGAEGCVEPELELELDSLAEEESAGFEVELLI